MKSGLGLGRLARQNGFDSVFIQTSKRRSFYMDAIAKALGFRQYYGKEDMPPLLAYPDPDGAAFGWDYEGFMKLGQCLNAFASPFLAVFFSGTTHLPFPELPPPFDNYPSGAPAFADMLKYADYSLGVFMEQAATQPWFKDTVFIITADHDFSAQGNPKAYPDDYRVPLLIYSPGNIAPGLHKSLTSHLDILPTLIELAGWRCRAAAIGRNVFAGPAAERLAFTADKDLTGLLSADAWVRLSGDKIIGASAASDEERAALAGKLLAYVHVVNRLVNENRWNPPENIAP